MRMRSQTDRQEHELDLSVETCDSCQGTLSDTGETEYKDEFDVKVMVVKRRHHYHIYECTDCGARVRLQIGRNLKEPNQYGSNLQAAALSLMATENVAINKVCMLIHGMTGERWIQVRDLSANYTGGHLWRLRDSWQDSDA